MHFSLLQESGRISLQRRWTCEGDKFLDREEAVTKNKNGKMADFTDSVQNIKTTLISYEDSIRQFMASSKCEPGLKDALQELLE